MDKPFVDIHCHMLPRIDDGAADEATALAMARMAVQDGIRTTIVTPHQLGSYAGNRGDAIRSRAQELQAMLAAEGIDLTVLPGADVRIEEGMFAGLRSGDVLSLGDHRRHVLLELPHELYFPLAPVLARLDAEGMVGILSHPERNHELLHTVDRTTLLTQLVEEGCLLQITAGSLVGGFGPASQEFAEELLREGLVHFLATDAHSVGRRRPELRPALARATEIVGAAAAMEICCENPQRVAEGKDTLQGRLRARVRRRGWRRLLPKSLSSSRVA